MKTKFILHGGFTKGKTEENNGEFYTEILKDAPEGAIFYSPSADKVDEGLGFLPLKIIPHYSENYKGKLDNVGQGLESLLLPEYEFKVFEK